MVTSSILTQLLHPCMYGIGAAVSGGNTLVGRMGQRRLRRYSGYAACSCLLYSAGTTLHNTLVTVGVGIIALGCVIVMMGILILAVSVFGMYSIKCLLLNR